MAGWGNRNGRVTSDEMLEQENQLLTENLANKVSRLKNLAFDIHSDTKEHNRYLDSMDGDFDSSRGLLSGSITRLGHMVSSGKDNRKIMCYIIIFLVLVFIVSYYFVSWFRAG